MKLFNQEITVTVSVDTIAQNLLSKMGADEKHAELLTETIVGNLLNSKIGISQLYNALNGYTNEINFKVGEEVISKERISTYVSKNGAYEHDYINMEECVIEEIDTYKQENLHVKYNSTNNRGEIVSKTMWIRHTNCSKLISEDLKAKIVGKIDLTKRNDEFALAK